MAKMINIKVGTNTSRKQVVVDNSKTIREVFQEAQIDYSTAIVYCDGSPLEPGMMAKTLEEANVTDGAMLIAVVKANNA